VWGEPIAVPADADEATLEAARKQVEERLNEITRQADLLCRKPAVEPAEVSATGAEAGGALPPAPLESTGGTG
jgi:hypothetical protein